MCLPYSIFEPVLNYADTALGNLSIGCSTRLQRLQNRGGRIITRRDSSRDALNLLNWTDLETNRKIHNCFLVCKCLPNLVPEYLSDYFTRNSSIHSYNTEEENLIFIYLNLNLLLENALLVTLARCFSIHFLLI
jgi:hypothetical protein